MYFFDIVVRARFWKRNSVSGRHIEVISMVSVIVAEWILMEGVFKTQDQLMGWKSMTLDVEHGGSSILRPLPDRLILSRVLRVPILAPGPIRRLDMNV